MYVDFKLYTVLQITVCGSSSSSTSHLENEVLRFETSNLVSY